MISKLLFPRLQQELYFRGKKQCEITFNNTGCTKLKPFTAHPPECQVARNLCHHNIWCAIPKTPLYNIMCCYPMKTRKFSLHVTTLKFHDQ